MSKEYKLNIDPRILELLGPSLYTNIYYVLAELIANAYDADAHNVYIIANKDDITVEDDGKGMSYAKGDVQKYLNVAAVSRNSKKILIRRLIGRKWGGKELASWRLFPYLRMYLLRRYAMGKNLGLCSHAI
jgi:HSP90 family molecular chaperone